MKFETIEEVAAPQDYTFARFTDFTRYEGLARKYGADIRRVGGFTEVAEGATWRGTMQVRGKTRGVEARSRCRLAPAATKGTRGTDAASPCLTTSGAPSGALSREHACKGT